MQTLTFDNREDWLSARKGKITGTRLKDIITKRGTGYKIGVYELIAERIAIEPDEENVMERGVRLEDEAIERFKKETGKDVNTSLVIWTRDDETSIAVSPDGIIGEKEAVEVKCLSSARHIEALITQEVPSDYEEQALQYFIVNDKLETLYLVFYDTRIPSRDFFFLEIKRDSVQEKIDEYIEYERKILEYVRAKVEELTF